MAFRYGKCAVGLALLSLVLLLLPALAQETTAGLQGTVKDPSGAVVSKATVEVSSPALLGIKKLDTDAAGYYRFTNLPSGIYALTVTAKGFRTYKQSGIELQVGRFPNLEVALQVGAVGETVEVTGQAPIVDVTQSKVATNVTEDILSAIPKGRSFQSVIAFAPGARQEPMQSRRDERQGGRRNGFQIDGASDSENVYLVEGMNTTNVLDGGIGRNVPFEFVQEVQIKSSSFEAEYGGALGGVVNVIQKRGGNNWHGSVFSNIQTDALNANDQCITRGFINTTCGLRADPTTTASGRFDQQAQYYLAQKDRWKQIEPGFEVGGPVLKDRLWLFTSYVPSIERTTRTVNFTNADAAKAGPRAFTRNDTQHSALSRLDARLTNSLTTFASWQYFYARTSGINLPGTPDSVTGQRNNAASTDPTTLRQDTGTVNPSGIYNFGADWTVTPRLVVTGRVGYFFDNTADRFRPTGTRYRFQTTLSGTTQDIAGNLLAANGSANAAFQAGAGFANMPSNLASVADATKRKSILADASYLGRFHGSHTIKWGYATNRIVNQVQQGLFTSLVDIFWNDSYGTGTPTGDANCASIIATNVATFGAAAANKGCRGSAGYFLVRDGTPYTQGKAASYNHSLYVQDAWTIKGLTINAGVRFDKEFLPPYGDNAPSISFGFQDKVAPRIGAAYDLLHNGKVKIYGSYGRFFDIMKYNLPRGSFGGDYWHDCAYAMDFVNFNTITPTAPVSAQGAGAPVPHACSGSASTPAPGVTVGRFIENVDFRAVPDPTDPGVDPRIKPMQQHEFVAGTDWAITPSLALEVRYSRKRLDRTIEDLAVTDSLNFYIGNPGTPFADMLHRSFGPAADLVPPQCPSCPLQPTAIRNYDGIEFRLTKRGSERWFGQLSYTYSKLNGNYSGLTATDPTDGNGGRHSPNNHRSFDHPDMQFDSHGRIIDGPLATDRPHTLKLFGYYNLKWLGQITTLGFSQSIFSGVPVNTCLPTVNTASSCMFVEGRGKWVDFVQDPATGAISAAGVRDRRSPAYLQTDFNFVHEMKVSKSNEAMRVGFEANVANLFNQHSAVGYVEDPLTSNNNFRPVLATTPASPVSGTTSGVNWSTLLGGYNYVAAINPGGSLNPANANQRFNAQYGLPNLFQGGRTMRLKLKFTF